MRRLKRGEAMERAVERVGDLKEYLLRGLNAGKTMKEIAKELGVSAGAVGYWVLKFGLRKEVRWEGGNLKKGGEE